MKIVTQWENLTVKQKAAKIKKMSAARWSGVSKAKRSAHAKMMITKRWANRL